MYLGCPKIAPIDYLGTLASCMQKPTRVLFTAKIVPKEAPVTTPRF